MIGSRRAFTLLELLMIIVLGALVFTVAAAVQQQDRAAAWKQMDIQRLGSLQSASAAFSLSTLDMLPSTLPGGRDRASFYPVYARYSPEPDVVIRQLNSDLEASAKWAINAIRRLGGRTSSEVSVPPSWTAGIYYSHLAIADFLEIHLPTPQFVSAADRFRLRWHNTAAFDAGAFGPYQPATSFPSRWPYSSSFHLVPAAWSPDRSLNGTGGVLRQGSTHSSFTTSGLNTIGNRRLDEVVHPSRKICWFDEVGRYAGRRDWFFAQAESEGLSSTFDGSVQFLATGAATGASVPPHSGLTYTGHKINPGWDPLQPTSAIATTYQYQPQRWEPPNRNGTYGVGITEILRGFQRYCRGGLSGIDFGGREVR